MDKADKPLVKPDGLKMFDDFSAKMEDVEESKRTLVVRITTDHKDRDDEVVLPGGLDLTEYNENKVVLFAHRYDMPAIGESLWIKTGEHEVIAKPRFADTERAEEIYKLYAGGYMKAWSIGFGIKEGGYRKPTEKDVQARPDWEGARGIIEKSTLFEYSAVPVPCNPYALSLAVEKGLVKVPAEIQLLDIGEPWHVQRDSPGEYVAFLRTPDDFKDDSFRRVQRTYYEKKYTVVTGRLKSDDSVADQAAYYPMNVWTAEDATKQAGVPLLKQAEPPKPKIIRVSVAQPKIIRVSTEPAAELVARIRREEEARVRGKMSL